MPRKSKAETPPPTPLGDFDGRDVIGSRIRIKGAGDGLSAAMATKPVAYHVGDEVTIVMRCTVGPITFKQVKDTEALERVHDFIAGTSTVIDDDVVADVLDEQERRNEEATGLARLPTDGTVHVGGDPEDGE